MHDDIKKFYLDGELSDANIVQTKERLVQAQEAVMREQGYVPDLDKDPQFTLNFVPEKSKYVFALTVYGIYVGKDKAWAMGGVMGGKTIMKSTPLAK